MHVLSTLSLPSSLVLAYFSVHPFFNSLLKTHDAPLYLGQALNLFSLSPLTPLPVVVSFDV